MTTTTAGACPYCGAYWHSGMCPRIESIEYHRDGSVKSIKLRETLAPTQIMTWPDVPSPLDMYPPEQRTAWSLTEEGAASLSRSVVGPLDG